MTDEQTNAADAVKAPFNQREYFKAWIARKLVADPDYLRRKSAQYYVDHPDALKNNNARYRERVGFTKKHSGSEKLRARGRLRAAVGRGTIVKPTECPSCQETVPVHRMHAHHADYSKPLDVTWLCSTCHGKEHRKTA